MKILRIALRNLASLETAEVDLEGDLLGRSPIFALTGRTGSGKSTLLDALCLALYGKTPRYGEGNALAAEVGGLKGDDERQILRRGTGSGWAVAEYRGRDGGRYRVRWEIRRAGGKPDGPVQPVRRRLERFRAADGTWEVRAEGIRETGQAVERSLGLSFDQFRHAVLLAQGEFQAFLNAPARERSALLEALTGTEIYSRLSVEAHRRGQEAKAALEDLERRIEACTLLPPEERAAVEADRAGAEARERELEHLLAEGERRLAWFDEEARRRAERDRAQEALAVLEQETSARAEDLRILERFERAEPVRPDWARRRALRAEREETLRERAEALEREADLATRGEEAALRREQARAEEERARSEAERLAGPLAKARELDGRIASAAVAEEQARAARDRAEAARDAAEERLAGLRAAREALLGVLEEDRTWRTDRAALEDLLARPGESLARLDERVRRERDRARAERILEELERRGAALAEEIARREAEERELLLREKDLRAERDRAREALEARDPEGLAARLEALRAEEGFLAEGLRAGEALREAEERLRALEREIREGEDRLRRAADGEAVAGAALRAAEGEAALLRETLRGLEAALGKDRAALRAELRPGTPCPVCGSREHPWAGEAAWTSLNEELAARRGELAGREEALAALRAEERRQGEERAAAEALRARLEGDRENARQGREEAAGRWAALRDRAVSLPEASGELFSGEPSPKGLDALRSAREEAARRLREAEAERTETDRWSRRVEELQGQLDGLAGEIRAGGEALRLRREEWASGEADRARAETARDSEALRIGEIRAWFGERAACRPDWIARLETDPAGLRRELEAEARAWRERGERIRENERALAEGERAAVAAEAERRAAEAERDRREEEWAGRRDEREALRRDREALLGGEAADSAEERLRTEQERARREREAEERRADSIRLERERAGEALRGLEERIGRLDREELGIRERLLAFAAAEPGLVPPEAGEDPTERLGAILDRDGTWIEELRAWRERTTSERGARRARVETLEAHLRDHLKGRPPGDRAACEAEREEWGREREAVRARREAAVLRLGRDEEVRRERERLEAALPAARETFRVRGALRELIGSADGKRFRDYAQGLTLRILAEQANEHLGRLRPRYRLRQNERDPMDLVLEDRDMGGEIRPARSLSGGESFLASLALALGLSDLASARQSVDSLFIDEGFGTLDAKTLETALAALQSLHAQGKQVGLVTHVEGVAERLGAEVRVEVLSPGRSAVRVRRPG